MTELLRNFKQTCQKKVWTDNGWHFHICGRPAKYRLSTVMGSSHTYYCGIHARRYQNRAQPGFLLDKISEVKHDGVLVRKTGEQGK